MTAPTRTIAAVVLAGAAMTAWCWPRAPRLRPRRRASHPPVRPGTAGRRPRGSGAARRRTGWRTPGRRRPPRRIHAVHPRARAAGRARPRQGPVRSELRELPCGGPARRATRARTCCARASRSAISTASWSAPALAQAQPAAHARVGRYRRHRRIHPQHSRHHERPGQPARTQSDRDRAERARRRRRRRAKPYFARRLLEVSLGDRRSERHRREVPDARALQNAWVVGIERPRSAAAAAGAAAAAARATATVTMADGSKIEGTLVRKDDWLVILMLPDGTRKSMARNNGVPEGRRQGSEGPAQEDGAGARRPREQEDARRHRVSVDDQVEAPCDHEEDMSSRRVAARRLGAGARAERQPGSPRRHTRASGLEGPDAADLARRRPTPTSAASIRRTIIGSRWRISGPATPVT